MLPMIIGVRSYLLFVDLALATGVAATLLGASRAGIPLRRIVVAELLLVGASVLGARLFMLWEIGRLGIWPRNDTHLHVPLYVHHPAVSPHVVDDVVTTRDLFGMLQAGALERGVHGTLLDPDYRAAHPVALAEHFHYPHVARARPVYRQNQAAAIVGTQKLVVRGDGAFRYDLMRDPDEEHPEACTVEAFAADCGGVLGMAAGRLPFGLENA